jgi:RHS repeat-associated protein
VGNSPLVDYRYALSGSQYDPVDLGAYLPGVSQTDRTTDTTHYLHNDHLGSTWYMSGDDVTSMYRRAVRTGFGQHVVGTGSGPDSRYGYAGSWGYQEHDLDADGAGDGQPDNRLNASYATGFPYLHVGARYYDPGSGRFLQRDPIGIWGGLNVYEYVDSDPLGFIDPHGLNSIAIGAGTGALSAADLAFIGFGTGVAVGAWEASGAGKAVSREAASAAIAAAALLCGAKHTGDQEALVELAKDAKNRKVPLTKEDAEALLDWAKETGLRGRGPESHPGRPHGKKPHIHIGPVDHIGVDFHH